MILARDCPPEVTEVTGRVRNKLKSNLNTMLLKQGSKIILNHLEIHALLRLYPQRHKIICFLSDMKDVN